MKRIVLILTALLATTGIVNAQLLWKISGNGLTQPSYIFGTHHLAPLSITETTLGFNEALNEVSAVYGEIEMDKMQSTEAQQQMMAMLMAPADSTLNKVFTPEQLASIDALLSRYSGGMPISTSNFNGFKPVLLSNTLTLLLAAKAFPDFNPMQQLDASIQQIAAAKGKIIKGFETVDFQMNLLFGNSIAEQAAELLKAVDNEDIVVEMTRLLTQAYITGDLDEMLRLMNDPRSGMTAEQAEKVITERNATWVQLLLGILPTASIMIVVGAGHLPGENGLISLLQKAGFSVTPVE